MFCKKIQLQKGFMKQMKYNVDELKNGNYDKDKRPPTKVGGFRSD